MADNDSGTPLTPRELLALAWNQIVNARQELPATQYNALTHVLAELDTVFYQLPDAPQGDQVPLCAVPCRHCGAHGVGV